MIVISQLRDVIHLCKGRFYVYFPFVLRRYNALHQTPARRFDIWYYRPITYSGYHYR